VETGSEGFCRYRFNQEPALPLWNLFRIIESLAALPDRLAFCSRKGRWRTVGLDSHGIIRIAPLPAEASIPAEKASRVEPSRKTRHGCQLQAVHWPGGKAFLDSRGLLHLKSHNPAVPEVSLVLADGEVAGWTSDGYVCGPSFFFEEARPSEPIRVFERVLQFLKSL